MSSGRKRTGRRQVRPRGIGTRHSAQDHLGGRQEAGALALLAEFEGSCAHVVRVAIRELHERRLRSRQERTT